MGHAKKTLLKKEKNTQIINKKVHVTVYVCVRVCGFRVSVWRVGAWVCECLGVGFFFLKKKSFLCVCVFFFFFFFF